MQEAFGTAPSSGWTSQANRRHGRGVSSDARACPFCFPDPGRTFYEGERVWALWDLFPVAAGHALLVTKRHVESWFDATLEEQRDLTSAISVARRAIVERYGPDGFNIGVNDGSAAGQTVPHLHVHVIPRYRGDLDDPRGGVRGVLPDKKIYPSESAADSPVVRDERGVPYSNVRASTPLTGSTDAAAFSERILQLLDQGRFTATYKFAVLLALIDVCLQHSTSSGAAPVSLPTRSLAERVLELYWPHTAPYSARQNPAGKVLVQNTAGQAEIVGYIARFRERWAPDPSAPLSRARYSAVGRYDKLVDQIEWKLIEMPLPRLQQVGDQEIDFLYRIDWDRSVRRRDLEEGRIARRIQLAPGAGEQLVRLAGILRPLIERQWAGMVAALNEETAGEVRLQQFLFGATRIDLGPVRDPLRDLQEDRCFYCDGKLSREVDVDHFVPWARYPDNGIENLVAADPRCNNRKRDFLAAGEHVERWVDRVLKRAADLEEIARRAQWERHPERTTGVARGIYLRVPDDLQLWRAGNDFVSAGAERARLAELLAT